MENRIRCNDCRRCVWDPVGGGYVLHCYANDFETRVHMSQKETFLVEGCRLALERNVHVAETAEYMEEAHRQYDGNPKVQSKLEMFSGER